MNSGSSASMKNFFEHVALPSFLPMFIRPWSFPVSLCWGRMLNCTNIAWVIAREKVPPNNNDVSQEISGGIWSALLNGMKVNGRVSAGDLTSSQWVLSLKAGYRERRLKTKHWGMSWGEGWFCPYFSVLSASPPNIYGWKMSWNKVSPTSGRRRPVCISCLLGKLNRRTVHVWESWASQKNLPS